MSAAARRAPRSSADRCAPYRVTKIQRMRKNRAQRASCGGSPREGARSELASVAATGGGGRSAPDPDQVRLLLFGGRSAPDPNRRRTRMMSVAELSFERALDILAGTP